MLILGVESSCDETGLALLSITDGKISLVNEVLSSQVELHAMYGGVVPELASREHLTNLPILFQKLFETTKYKAKDLSVIGVTIGPGLKGALLMGLNFARGLALGLGIPVYGINHLEGHILVPRLNNQELKFPYLALVVSGGHTEIYLVNNVGAYTVLSRTTDDAAGECYDKSANILGFSYPGGAKLAALADTISESEFILPRINVPPDQFSFSGLKTAISRLVQKHKDQIINDDKVKAKLAFTVQQTINLTLINKVKYFCDELGINSVVVTGGVSANRALRKEMANLNNIKVFFPEPKHSVDNGVMIGFALAERLQNCGEFMKSPESVYSRWPLEEVRI